MRENWLGKTALSLFLSASYLQVMSIESLAASNEWKEGFAGCSGNSPFINSLIVTQESSRPLMKIGDMQAWVRTDESGEKSIALTTTEGLTIIGKIIGPQGEDISAALLATVPDTSLPNPYASSPTASSLKNRAPVAAALPKQTVIANLPKIEPKVENTQIVATAPPASAFIPNKPLKQEAATLAAPVPVASTASRAVTAVTAPTSQQQAGLNALYDQAEAERMYFSAGTAKPNAPVIYMIADPSCPHCKWSIDKHSSAVEAGEIDLRVIFAPITGPQGFNDSLAILHSKEIPKTFMDHMLAPSRGTPAVPAMDLATADKGVVQSIVNNINWMRQNGIRSVPFYIYKTNDGAQFSAGDLPENIMTVAKAE